MLGALVEKETTTPEYYPLSVNALLNACNQKSNRDPVMTLTEDEVREALGSLSDQALVRTASGDSRVPKFEHRLSELFNFHRHEIALLAVLMLRGPQTTGELRVRTERMYAFDDLDAVHAALNLLMRREPPLVKVLPRQPGTKEVRYVHLFSGDRAPAVSPASHAASPAPAAPVVAPDRLQALEEEVALLRKELEALRKQFSSSQKSIL